jgi:gamma-glutamylputrescine oxidase
MGINTSSSFGDHGTLIFKEILSMNVWMPQDQVFWYLKRNAIPACHESVTADVAIIGGGMAGLAAAQAFQKKGKKVVLLEQYYCGSGASGKSSGFITPNAELSFTDFSKHYNPRTAKHIWDFITSGVNDIRNNIAQHQFACDYAPQDTLMVANTMSALKSLEIEHHNLARAGYKTEFYTQDAVRNHIGSKDYVGAITYEETFGISGYLYCQELKNHLQKLGVMIFEETAVTAINDHVLTTAHAKITADYIVVCTDRFMPELGLLTQEVYHAQTFLMISEPLTDAQIHAIFPQKSHLVWDSEFVYNYFRMTSDKRLLLGGGSVLTTYASKPGHDSQAMFTKLTRYFDAKFPGSNIQFKQLWPGLIGLSKDIAPIAGRDKDRPFLYYVSAAAGLPIAAALGRYSAEHLIDGKTDLDDYFSPYRSFAIGGALQSILGTKLSFVLCNSMKKFAP